MQSKEFVYSVPISEKKPGETAIRRHPNLLMVSSCQKKELIAQLITRIKNGKKCWILFCQKQSQESLSFLQKLPIVDIAAWNYGLVTIPLYSTLGQEALYHILKLTEGRVVASVSSMCDTMLNSFKKQRGNLTTLIMFDSISEQHRKKFEELKFQIVMFSDLVKQELVPRPQLNLDAHLSYSFTSGTTGLPKGAINNHRNVICQTMVQTDVHISYLPVAHTFERFMIWQCISSGATIKYAKHPPTQILKDLATIKPTILPIVPRLLNRLYQPMKAIFQKYKSNQKIKAAFRGKLRIMATGSAPVSAQILHFFKKVLEIDLRQGYGQTQTTAATFIIYEGDTNFGHVGGINRCTQFKLIDVPQMQYSTDSNEPKGQVCERGPSIFVGYYHNQENTKSTLDSDGWNHSGDIGIILPNGSLQLIDRRKNIFKLSHGQYIAPEKIQNIYMRCPYVAECFLYGDSLKDHNVAVVFPYMDQKSKAAESLKIEQKDPQKLCRDERIIKFVLQAMNKQGRDDGLFGFQLAKALKLCPKSFTTFGIYTSTLKLQRLVAKKQSLQNTNLIKNINLTNECIKQKQLLQ